ncbi:VirB4 family type IV secretion system protein [Kiloniella laminariae]|uniref:VirB4 family type IV secretion system protein n=1 Tax=Kiloniella laminariae TaxID=454162 RepID=UPI000374B3C4|nr:VirB4 family type IV secretion system protein [Kiloniella laminariae]
MLENAIPITGLVMAGAALVVPATRKLLLGSVEQDWLAKELEFDHIDQDRVTVHLKDKTLFRVFSIKGEAYETKPEAIQNHLCSVRSDLLNQLGESGAVIRMIGIKRQEDVSFDADWPSITLEEIGKAEQKLFKHSYDISWFIVVQSRDFNVLDKATHKIHAVLADYQVTPLAKAVTVEDTCPLTGFINFLVSGELRTDLPAISNNISGNIPASDLHFDADGSLETHTPQKRLSRVIAIRQWPELLQGLFITEIMALKGDLELNQICIPLHNEKTLTTLRHKQGQYSNEWFGNGSFAGEHEFLISEISSGKATLFDTQFQIVCRAETDVELKQIVDDVCGILSKRRVIYSIETTATPVCWFNRLPGQDKLVRPLRITNHNIAALWPFQYSPKGLLKSPFGNQPIRLFKTPTGQSYAMQFHCSDKRQSPGNYLVFAPIGSGKSTLMLHLLGGLSKFNGVRNYVFDSNEGARFMVEAMGGIYQSYDNLALNPLDVAVDTLQSRQGINLIIRAMIGDSLQDDMDDAINHAISTAFKLDRGDRTFSNIFESSFPPKSAVRRAMQKWVKDSKGKVSLYSHIFNSPHDQLGGFLEKSFLTGINMNEALKDEVLGPPVVAHISTAIKAAARNNNQGFSIFIDEAGNLLRNKGFREVALEMYREYRKNDGLVGMAFQDPKALLNFPDYEGILNNTQTLFFFPNPTLEPDNLEAFNLNDEQISFICGGGYVSGDRRVLVVKRDAANGYSESAIVNVDLSGLGDCLRFYRAGTEANNHLQTLKEKWGEQWLQHV